MNATVDREHLLITGCTFDTNQVVGFGSSGGAVGVFAAFTREIETAADAAYAASRLSRVVAAVTNTAFTANYAHRTGGAIFSEVGCNITMKK